MERYAYELMHQVEATHWWFVGRRTLILDQVAQRYRGQANLRLLDVGCGTGIFADSLNPYGQVTGLDLSPEALKFCRRRGSADFVQGDAVAIPFRDNTFDVITANDLVEHLEDDLGGLREFGRVLKPRGRAFIFVPAYQFLWSLQDEISHHKRRYTAGELTRVIGRSGLCVDRITYANTLLFPVVWGGRQALKVVRRFKPVQTENDLHPQAANGVLAAIFKCEAPLLRRVRFPFGVSILAVCQKR
jgi:SAM-dependent methyltransferase